MLFILRWQFTVLIVVLATAISSFSSPIGHWSAPATHEAPIVGHVVGNLVTQSEPSFLHNPNSQREYSQKPVQVEHSQLVKSDQESVLSSYDSDAYNEQGNLDEKADTHHLGTTSPFKTKALNAHIMQGIQQAVEQGRIDDFRDLFQSKRWTTAELVQILNEEWMRRASPEIFAIFDDQLTFHLDVDIQNNRLDS